MTSGAGGTTFGEGHLSERESTRDELDERMVRAARQVGSHFRAATVDRPPPDELSAAMARDLKRLLWDLAKRTPLDWFDVVHGATAEYARLLSGFPQALRPIQQLLYFEPLLYAEPSGKWYKDHLAHQLRVTRLLFLLIEAARRRYPGGLGSEPETLYPAALMAGLFHDIGYPLALLRSLSESRYQTHWSSVLQYQLAALRPVVDRSLIAQRLVGFGVCQDPTAWIEREINKNSRKAHAFLSGVWLLGFKDELLRLGKKPGELGQDPPDVEDALRKLEVVLERAACATFFHHIHEHAEAPRMRARLRECPLMVLLQLADMLQEWGRPIVVRDPAGHLDFVVPNQQINLKVDRLKLDKVQMTPGPKASRKQSPEKIASEWKELVYKRPEDVGEKLGWVASDHLVDQLQSAGWEPWRPCEDIPKALRQFDPEAILLLRDLEELTDDPTT